MTASSSRVATPRIVGYLFGLVAIYGVWLLEPRWITGAIALLILYSLLTNVDRATLLVSDANSSLRGLIAPTPASAGRRGGP